MIHPQRAEQTRALADLDPATDYHAIHRLSILDAYGKTGRLAYQLAYFRTLAMPSIATLMMQTGATSRDPEKRAIDTGLIMFEIIHDGLDGPRARRMTSVINRAHHGLPLRDEDNTYVLAMFMVGAYQWLDRFGWRPSLPGEREASWRFYAELGRRLNVSTIPTSYTDAEHFIAAYEDQALYPSAQAHALVQMSLPVYSTRLPRLAQPFGPRLVGALIGSEATARAMGLPYSSPVTRALQAALRFKAAHEATTPPKPAWFTPGMALSGPLYATGYDLEDLGPDLPRPLPDHPSELKV